MARFIECGECEGSGDELVSSPRFDDPYRVRSTGEVCEACGGAGEIGIEDDEIELEDLVASPPPLSPGNPV